MGSTAVQTYRPHPLHSLRQTHHARTIRGPYQTVRTITGLTTKGVYRNKRKTRNMHRNHNQTTARTKEQGHIQEQIPLLSKHSNLQGYTIESNNITHVIDDRYGYLRKVSVSTRTTIETVSTSIVQRLTLQKSQQGQQAYNTQKHGHNF